MLDNISECAAHLDLPRETKTIFFKNCIQKRTLEKVLLQTLCQEICQEICSNESKIYVIQNCVEIIFSAHTSLKK